MADQIYKASILTLGCRVNQYESDSIVAALHGAGVVTVPFGEKCDIAIINTCTVTAESDRKSRQMIRRAASFSDRIAVTGCYAQISGDEAASLDKVVYVCGNGGKAELASVVLSILRGEYDGPVNAVVPPVSRSVTEMTLCTPMRTRSYIKIEDGCDNRCAYCLISTARGPVRSKARETVLAEAETLSRDTHEIILTGIETAAYGADFTPRQPYGHALADLICDVGKIGTVERIGLGSLDPTVMSDYFVTKIAAETKVLPHFHLSIQSGSTKILAAMQRKYRADMALEAIERMKKAMPDATFSCDVIVGFPGETDEDFSDTVEFCRKVGFLHLHIFPYSKRIGTKAADMPEQIPQEEKFRRAALLEDVGRNIKNELLDRYISDHSRAVGSPVYVLAEKSRGGVTSGHSEHFAEVTVGGCSAKIGEIVPVYLTSHDGDKCKGERV